MIIMTEPNLCNLLADAPKGMMLYSPMYGMVHFLYTRNNEVVCCRQDHSLLTFEKDGRIFIDNRYRSFEPMLFPNKYDIHWESFLNTKEKKLCFWTFNGLIESMPTPSKATDLTHLHFYNSWQELVNSEEYKQYLEIG
jgi:hypothetical protein